MKKESKKWEIDVKNLPELDALSVAFGGSSRDEEFLPPEKEIPEEFWTGNTKWNKFFSNMFYCGLDSVKFQPKEGVNPERAWRIIRCLSGSFASKHEHKTAGVSYLLSLFFDDVEWKAKPMKFERG